MKCEEEKKHENTPKVSEAEQNQKKGTETKLKHTMERVLHEVSIKNKSNTIIIIIIIGLIPSEEKFREKQRERH